MPAVNFVFAVMSHFRSNFENDLMENKNKTRHICFDGHLKTKKKDS